VKNEPDDPVQQVINEFKRLPGIGRKSAQRIAFHLIRRPNEEGKRLAEAISELKARLKLCSLCNNIAGADPCGICSDANRNSRLVCIVEEPFNVLSIEKTGQFKGVYHVLHGAISPIDGVGPDDLKIKNLFSRLREGAVEEVIVATNPTIEGETTALYLAKLIKPLDIKVSRIASGIPVGSDLEYSDEVTISRAITARQTI
jgi:recombination protein RecR